jgi:hypothetical protein
LLCLSAALGLGGAEFLAAQPNLLSVMNVCEETAIRSDEALLTSMATSSRKDIFGSFYHAIETDQGWLIAHLTQLNLDDEMIVMCVLNGETRDGVQIFGELEPFVAFSDVRAELMAWHGDQVARGHQELGPFLADHGGSVVRCLSDGRALVLAGLSLEHGTTDGHLYVSQKSADPDRRFQFSAMVQTVPDTQRQERFSC